MRKLILYLFTFVFTFTAGVAVVWIPSNFEDIAVQAVSQERFTLWVRCCSDTYSQYVTNDNQYVGEGVRGFDSPFEARREFHKELPYTTLVQFTGWNNEERKGERRILVGNEVSDTTILLYDGTDHIRFIIAPNEALAREFEAYLISIGSIVDLRSLYDKP